MKIIRHNKISSIQLQTISLFSLGSQQTIHAKRPSQTKCVWTMHQHTNGLNTNLTKHVAHSSALILRAHKFASPRRASKNIQIQKLLHSRSPPNAPTPETLTTWS